MKIKLFLLVFLALITMGIPISVRGQTNPNRITNSLQISQINAMGSINFDAQDEDTKQGILYKHAREMQNAYQVHIKLAYTIIRTNYIVTNLITTGSDGGDLANLRAWRQSQLLDANPQDSSVGFFMGNTYGGFAQTGPDRNGYRYSVIDAPSLSDITAHEEAHTFGMTLSGDHNEAVQNMTFTATRLSDGVTNTLHGGATLGTVARGQGSTGLRLQAYSVSNANNTGNPANGGDGNVTQIGEYFGEDHKISIPYTELQNPSGNSTADGIAKYYEGSGPGRSFRTEALPALPTPTVSVNGTSASFANPTAYNTIKYANTTDPNYTDTHATAALIEGYLYDANNAVDGSPIAGPIKITESFNGLAAGEYVLGVYEKIGNRSIAFSAPFSIEEATPLTAQCQDLTVALDATGNASITANQINNGSTGEGTLNYSLDVSSFTCDNVGTPVTVTFTVSNGTDSETCTATVTVIDTMAPTPNLATLPPINGQCEITSLTPPIATDNCNGTITATTNATLPITATQTIVWTYSDGVNTSTQTQEVVISDSLAPTPNLATLPQLNGQCEITSLTPPIATDNCNGTITATTNATLPITATQTIVWTYSDGVNTSTQTQEVVIADSLAPVPNLATLPQLNGQCEITSLTPPIATDNCNGTITATTNATLPITATQTIVWTYSDGVNTSTQTQEVVIADSLAPVPNLATLPPINGQCEITSLTPPIATDNCNGTITATTNATLPITASQTIVWTYSDGVNTSTQTQEVVIADSLAPTPNLATLPQLNGQCEITSLTPPIATDNCNGTITATTNATLPITATQTIVWTYSDGVNTSTQTQEVVIADSLAPTPNLATLPQLNGQCEITSLTPPIATDNCNGTITATTNATLPITATQTIV